MFDLYLRKMDLVGNRGYELPVQLVLSMLPSYKDNTTYITVDQLCYHIFGRYLDKTNDKRIIANVRKGLTTLIDTGKVKCIESNKDNYILDYLTCYCNIKEGNFVMIQLEELQTIMSNTNNCELLLYFCNLIGTVNSDSKAWHMSQEDMCECWNMNFVTIDKYNKMLEDMKLIYIHRPNVRKKDGTFHKVNNSYGRYVDRESIIADAGVYFANTDEQYYRAKDYIDGDTRTSIKMKYNAFVKGAKKYQNSPKLIEQLYTDCVKYNNSMDKQNEVNGVTPLDMSVFECIDIITGKYIVDGAAKVATPMLEDKSDQNNLGQPQSQAVIFNCVVDKVCNDTIDIDALFTSEYCQKVNSKCEDDWDWDMY